jgi:hypothetical protein
MACKDRNRAFKKKGAKENSTSETELYSSPSIITTMRWERHVRDECMQQAYSLLESVKERDHLTDLGVDRRISSR